MAAHAPAYLTVSRHGLYYFRITVPRALRSVIGARELKRSLKTTHRPTAIRLARAYALHCEALFESVQEPTVNYRQMRQVLEQLRDTMIAMRPLLGFTEGIWLSQDCLRASVGIRSVCVQCGTITKVIENKWSRLRLITIYFRRVEDLEMKLKLLPSGRHFALRHSHPIVDELRFSMRVAS